MTIRVRVNTAYLVSGIANFLFFSTGTTVTWTSSTLPKLQNSTENIFNKNITTDQLMWLTTLPTIGASISGYFYTYVADLFGRKRALLSLGMPYLIPYLLMGFKKNLRVYFIARFMLGVAAGGTFSVVPMYVVEMSTKFNRAILSSFAGVMICAGFLFSYSVGPFLSISTFNLTLAIFPAIFIVLFFIYGEETSYFYLKNGQECPARRVLEKIKGKNVNVDDEIEKLRRTIFEQKEHRIRDYLKNKIFIRHFLSLVGLFIFQQLTGINVLLMFNQDIFKLSKINMDSSTCSMMLGVIYFISSFIGSFISEKYGRRKLLIISGLLMSIVLTGLGLFCLLLDVGIEIEGLNLFPAVMLCLFILSYSVGFCSIPFVILSEILPWRIKSTAISVVCTVYWGTVALIVNYFAVFVDQLGLGVCFIIFSVFTLSSVIFVYFCIEETKGRTLEEIQDMWKEQI